MHWRCGLSSAWWTAGRRRPLTLQPTPPTRTRCDCADTHSGNREKRPQWGGAAWQSNDSRDLEKQMLVHSALASSPIGALGCNRCIECCVPPAGERGGCAGGSKGRPCLRGAGAPRRLCYTPQVWLARHKLSFVRAWVLACKSVALAPGHGCHCQIVV